MYYKSDMLPPFDDIWYPGPRCLYNKVRYFRGFCVLVVGGAYVYNVRYQVYVATVVVPVVV
jgi:hypothetical protein